ncbi:putative N-acetyltransferase YjcF [mine drainage metagenome]|uniref:Putative N-acetyltransferase YjcF n=1 Tax=mine drainage metagenome TaxID=410659 RepID=A0A1J5QRH5_9ZZZZ
MMSKPHRDAFRFLHRLQVRWAEVDMQRVVFNGHYLMYADSAVGAFWKSLGVDYSRELPALGGDFYVKRAQLTWHAPAQLDDWIDVGVAVDGCGRSSLRLRTAMWVQDRLLVEGELLQVYASTEPPLRAQPLPDALRELLQAHAAGEPMLQLRVGGWDELGAHAGAIRSEVFVDEQGVPAELEWDARDAGCVHAVAYNRLGRALACARLLPDGHIGRVAVRRGLRGSGAGVAVMRALLDEARRAGHAVVELSAQRAVLGFYRKLGFVAFGEPYVEAGIEHQDMRLALG